MRHVFETMGTVASVQLRDGDDHHLGAIGDVFRAVDARFSLYSESSELSRVASGALALFDASAILRDSYARALEWRTLTGGLFSPHRPDGVIDLNGIVKAEAIERAGELLDEAGCRDWTIDVGGDILVGERIAGALDPAAAPRQRFGIVDPTDAGSLLCSIALVGSRRAIATSGSAERGDHIWARGALAPSSFVQVTVVADGIVAADVLATAIVAGGRDALDELTDRWPIDVIAVSRSGELSATPGMRAAISL